uniref:Uncharacterized protein n=1 Tax=Triticum urartu TaxID=4572 RepID=A0A8R7TP62_TRIUA
PRREPVVEVVRGRRRRPGEAAEPEVELRQEEGAVGEEREDREGTRVLKVRVRRRQRAGRGRQRLGGGPAALAAAATCPADGHVAERAAVRPVAAAGAAVVARLRGAVVVVLAELGVAGAAPRALQLLLLVLTLASFLVTAFSW